MPSSFSKVFKGKLPSFLLQESIELENLICLIQFFSNKKLDSQLDPPQIQKPKEYGFGENHSFLKIKKTKSLMCVLLILKALVLSKRM
jgi:hypothetical protein